MKTMNKELREQIYKNLDIKETNELIEIWQTNDRVEWSDLAFEILEKILKQRNIKLPKQNEPITEYKEENYEDENLEDWEVKLLDNKNQPEIYDVLEVLGLKDNINKVAKAVVVVYILLAIANFQSIQWMLQGYFPSMDELPGILWSLFLTIIAVGIQISVVYFPLKALSHILRILMEMEFNSRNAK